MSFTIGGGVNLEKCYTNLLSADSNNNGFISQSEFLTFLQSNTGLLNTNQYGTPLTQFSQLPQSFVGVYNFFACGDQFVGCPTLAGIDIQGLLNSQQQNGGGGEMLSEQQTTYLYRLCKDTEETVEEYESSVSTTPSPTTKSPTGEPTTSPKTNAPTSSPVASTPPPTTLPPTPTGTTSCPPQYTAGQSYAADDLVSNEVYESTQIPYFKCKPFPFAAWCSQAAYEPGVTIAWEEAWELMGVCDNSNNSGDGGTTTSTTTTGATVATTTAATTSGGTTTTTTVATNPSLSTPPPSPTPPTPTTTTTTIPTKRPTITNPEETPTSGPLPIQFQYEIGNNENLQSQSILTERNPINNMMEYLESGTDSFVKVIVDATFGTGGGGSSSSSSAVGAAAVTKEKADSLKVNNENVRRRRTTTTRNLAVTYNPTSVTIENIQDIACSYQNMTTESRCQKVTAGVTLQLTNEPPLTTNLRFQTGISNGIDMGLLTFPPESGIVYVGQTKSVQVIPEFGLLPDNGSGKGGNNNGGGGDSNTSNDKWVVPVSVTVAASVAAILILFAGSRFRKRQREGKEFDGAEQVSLEGDGNDVANDLSPEYNEYSYSPGSKRHMNIFEETIDETPTFNDSDSDLIDLERGGSVNNMTTMMNQSNNEQQHRSTSKNPFASSSSSGSNSDDEYIQQHQPVSHGFPLPSWKEVSEDDLSKSGEVGEMYMRDRDSTDYRAAVEALVRQACPEQIDNVDDLMAEYEGRESVLIGQLSVMLATQKEADRGKAFSMEDKRKGIDEPRLKSVLESGAAMADSKSFDESSAAGSSQWSTDDGMSSIDASMSASSSEREMLPDTYAAIGDAALITSDSNLMSTTFIKVEKNPDDEFSGLDIPGGEEKPRGQPITREDLDAAIEAGDWNAVGATAALLAGGSFDRRDSDSEYSSSQSDGGNISLSSMDYSDKDRAQEFEQLIEAGDWKAVMAIASEFEGAGESGSFQVSKLSDMEYDSSRRMSSSDVFERDDQALTKRQEIEELVRRVVPDEIENIDEMLLQFKGREDELIMTLQTMDERNQHSLQGSNSSLSSPASSKESSAESPGFQTLKQMPSFHEEHVFESDSILNESDYDTGKSSKSKTSSSNRGSDSDSSSSSEDLSNLIHR